MRSLFLLGAPIVVCCLAPIHASFSAEPQAALTPITSSGDSYHAARVQQEIAKLRGESAAESRRLLREDRQYCTPPPGGRMELEELSYQRLLATRRPLKVISEIAQEPAEQRAKILETEMRALADEYLQAAKVVVAWYADQDKPQNDVSFLGLRHSAATLLYAAASHTDEATVARLLRTWRGVRGPVQEVVDSATGMPAFPRKLLVQWASLPPEDAYNILMRSHEVSGGFEAVAKLELPDSVEKQQLVVTPWEAAANNYDFAVMVEGAEVDRSHGFELVDAYCFRAAAKTTTDRDEQLAFFEQFERLLNSLCD